MVCVGHVQAGHYIPSCLLPFSLRWVPGITQPEHGLWWKIDFKEKRLLNAAITINFDVSPYYIK